MICMRRAHTLCPVRACAPGIPSGFSGSSSSAWAVLSIRVRSVLSAARLPERRDPDSRVSCVGARAPAGARIAAARLARLIARARRRTHLACRLNRGRSAPGRHGREAVRADFASLGPIIPLFLKMQVPNREILLNFWELFVIRFHCPGSRLRGPERIPHQRPGYTPERDACMERAASGNAGGIMAVRAGLSRCRPSCAVRGAGSCRSS